ncbi:hypothetical protein E4U31_001781 [Claviceps sp. LM219 group G6]|nr:hypothetical protein E4U15_002583 [Claviceps sp. LM218 group G6]KAG6113076.1 hypothetical protein E4U31_001781 [Claviceps sp. LM219 group G6]KAG6120695.1 hypothetical protein E4U14_003202 [Claviceps sp. LM454 group G7]
MHVLGSIGHGFSQRRKNSSSKNLNIRKISLPCLSTTGSSFSSSSSTMSAPEPSSARSRTGSHGFGPLSLHPTFHQQQQQQQPPPRLHDRPLISPRQKEDQYEPPSFFHDDDFSESESADEEGFDDRQTVIGDDEEYTFCRAQVLHFSHCPQPKEMIVSSSPRTSAVDHDTLVDGSESRDYYMRQLAKRPAMPCSRWSDSTIQTLDFVDDIAPDETLPDEDEDQKQEEEEEQEATKEEVCMDVPMPNFSRKRITAPSRPPLRSLDSLDDFIKKSGWKRRGVIFDRSEARQHSVDF